MALTRDVLRLSWRSWLSRDEPAPGPWWLAYLWTLAFCVLIAVGFTLFGFAVSIGGADTPAMANWIRWYQTNLMISLCVGYAIHFLFQASIRVVGAQSLRRFKPWQRSVFYTAVPIVGVAIGWPLGAMWVLGVDMQPFMAHLSGRAIAGSVLLALLISAVFQQFFLIKHRQIQAENRATEAQLRLLQAQIEPHFLFNTLANVVSLMEVDPARAKAMLEAFVEYLRASLTGLGHASHRLGDEIDLVDAYLRIIKMRMEERLHYSIDVPAALRALPLPALSLQPLVENAIVHGLEPRIAGGTIRIAASLEQGALRLTVEDDGAGLPAAPAEAHSGAATPRTDDGAGTGTALANIRERLRQAHGGAAALHIEPLAPHGVRASLSLPVTA